MLLDCLDHSLRETLTAVSLQNVDVREVGESGLVRDDPREANLLASRERGKAERVVEGLLHDGKGNTTRPIGLRKEGVGRFHVHA